MKICGTGDSPMEGSYGVGISLPKNAFDQAKRENPLKNLFKNTQICSRIATIGFCPKGKDCNYAHTAEELRDPPNLKCTKWCRLVFKGKKCTEVNCPYAHCKSELRANGHELSTYKTSLCKFHEKGVCFNGEYCRFAHSNQELRETPLEADSHITNNLVNQLLSMTMNLNNEDSPYQKLSPKAWDPMLLNNIASRLRQVQEETKPEPEWKSAENKRVAQTYVKPYKAAKPLSKPMSKTTYSEPFNEHWEDISASRMTTRDTFGSDRQKSNLIETNFFTQRKEMWPCVGACACCMIGACPNKQYMCRPTWAVYNNANSHNEQVE